MVEAHDAESSRWDDLAGRYLQGDSLRELAAQEGITVAELKKGIHRAMADLVAEWSELKLGWMAQTQARLMLVEHAAWAEWERSKRPRVKVTRKEVCDARGERTEVTSTTEESAGDTRYLTIIFKCLTLRHRLDGHVRNHSAEPAGTPAESRAAVRLIIEQARERQAQIDARQRQADEIERTIARK